jgi:hypothetical protein
MIMFPNMPIYIRENAKNGNVKREIWEMWGKCGDSITRYRLLRENVKKLKCEMRGQYNQVPFIIILGTVYFRKINDIRHASQSNFRR